MKTIERERKRRGGGGRVKDRSFVIERRDRGIECVHVGEGAVRERRRKKEITCNVGVYSSNV
jgi:hypothetical protein